MRKILISALTVLMVLSVLTGCGQEKTPTESQIEIEKNGEITVALVDSFDKDYYDLEEFRDMVSLEIAFYNEEAGGQRISLESLELLEGNCIAVLKFQSAQDYAEYNELPFFEGTIEEAKEAGLNLNITLTETGKDTTVGKSEIENLEDYHLVMWYGDMPVKTPGKIRYYGDALRLLDSKRIVSLTSGQATDTLDATVPAGPFYLLYK